MSCSIQQLLVGFEKDRQSDQATQLHPPLMSVLALDDASSIASLVHEQLYPMLYAVWAILKEKGHRQTYMCIREAAQTGPPQLA